MTHYEALGKLAAYYAERPDLMHVDRAAERHGPRAGGLPRMRRRIRLARLRVRRRLRAAVPAAAMPGRVTP